MIRKQAGYTLVEMMVVAAILSILATLAVDSYVKYTRRAKTQFAKLRLVAVYSAEMNFLAEHRSFSQCLFQIGGMPAEADRPYYVGFSNLNGAATCGPSTNQSCSAFVFSPVVQTCTCNAVPALGTTDCAADSSRFTMVAQAGVYPWTVVNSTQFTVGAVGDIGGSQPDVWSIDQTKKLTRVQSGE